MNKKAAILSVVGVYGGAIGFYFVAEHVVHMLTTAMWLGIGWLSF